MPHLSLYSESLAITVVTSSPLMCNKKKENLSSSEVLLQKSVFCPKEIKMNYIKIGFIKHHRRTCLPLGFCRTYVNRTQKIVKLSLTLITWQTNITVRFENFEHLITQYIFCSASNSSKMSVK